MNLLPVGFVVGVLGQLSLDRWTMASVTEDTCTPAVVCQITSQISGSWSVGAGGTQKNGKCACLDTQDPPACVTVHCAVNITVTCTGGGSYRHVGTGPCVDGQPSKNLGIRNCGSGDAAMFMIYQGTGCQGTAVWHTYAVQCGDGDCGSYTCPAPPPNP